MSKCVEVLYPDLEAMYKSFIGVFVWYYSHSENRHTHPYEGATMFLGHAISVVKVHWI